MNSERGFTLIETLATLGIAGVVSVLLVGSLHFFDAAFVRTTALADASSDIYAAQTALRRVALNFANGTGGAHIAGNAQSLAMTTRFGLPGTVPASVEAGLAIAPCDQDRCLVLRLTYPSRKGAPAVSVAAPLMRGIQSVRLAYLDRAGQWHDAWRQSDGAPRLVRVDVAFEDGGDLWPALYLPLGTSS